MHFPIIRDFKGKMGGMSQMAITVGLCNALSLCLEATIKKIETKEHWDAMLEIEEHIQSIYIVLNHLRRHPDDIPRNNNTPQW